MNQLRFAGLALRLRLALLRAGPVMLGVLAVLLVSAAALAWLVHALFQQQAERDALRARAVLANQAANTPKAGVVAASLATSSATSSAPPPDNLDAFYAALGQRRNAEQQVRILFQLAAKNGLVLSQGEYKSAWDRNARVHTYQVNLPVKGSYAAIWQFALAALRAIPYAALDDISFRRDSIGDPAVEARLRLTFYLADGAGGAP